MRDNYYFGVMSRHINQNTRFVPGTDYTRGYQAALRDIAHIIDMYESDQRGQLAYLTPQDFRLGY